MRGGDIEEESWGGKDMGKKKVGDGKRKVE